MEGWFGRRSARAKKKAVAIDASHTMQLDTAGAWLLSACAGPRSPGCESRNCRSRPELKMLLDEVRQQYRRIGTRRPKTVVDN